MIPHLQYYLNSKHELQDGDIVHTARQLNVGPIAHRDLVHTHVPKLHDVLHCTLTPCGNRLVDGTGLTCQSRLPLAWTRHPVRSWSGSRGKGLQA